MKIPTENFTDETLVINDTYGGDVSNTNTNEENLFAPLESPIW